MRRYGLWMVTCWLLTSCDPVKHVEGFDTGSELRPVDEGWIRIWMDASQIVSSQPTAVLPVTWSPCPSGRLGCEVMQSFRMKPVEHPQYWVGDKGYVTFGRNLGWGDGEPWEHVVANVVTGEIVFVGRTQGDVGYGSIGLSSKGLAYYATDLTRAAIFRQPYEGTPVVQMLANYLGGEERPLWMADTTVVSRTTDAMAEIKGNKVIPCGLLSGQPHALFGNTVLMMVSFRQLYELRCPTAKPLAIPNDGKRLGGFTIDTTTTPKQVLWVQGDTSPGPAGGYAKTELWSAPVVGESVEPSKSRKVADVAWGSEKLIAAHGYFAAVVSETQLQLTRLGDGKQVMLEVDTGWLFDRAVVLERDHVWVTTRPGIEGRGGWDTLRLKFAFP